VYPDASSFRLSPNAGTLAAMKILLVIALILLLLLVGLPVATGHTGHMGDCPACPPANAPFALGLCAGVLSFVALILLLSSSQFRLLAQSTRQFLLTTSIFRPPRPA